MIALVTVVTSSGSEVPSAITVTAMTRSDTPIRCARSWPFSTSRFEPTNRPAAETTSIRIAAHAGMSFSDSSNAASPSLSFHRIERNVYAAKPSTSTMPTARTTVPTACSAAPSLLMKSDSGVNRTVRNSSAAVATKKIMRQLTDFALTSFAGRISCPMPAMSAVLQMMLPSALPTLISGECALPRTAVLDTRISGSVVPRDTIVAPTTICGIFNRRAIATDASTNLSPATQMRPSPTTNRTIVQASESGTEKVIRTFLPCKKKRPLCTRNLHKSLAHSDRQRDCSVLTPQATRFPASATPFYEWYYMLTFFKRQGGIVAFCRGVCYNKNWIFI